MTKGEMIKALKQVGIRRAPDGKRFHEVKTYHIINLYYDTFGGFKK